MKSQSKKLDKFECKKCKYNPSGIYCELMETGVSHDYYCYKAERSKYSKNTRAD